MIWHILYTMAVSYLSFEIATRLERRRQKQKTPYRWNCMKEDCGFYATSNSINILVTVVDKHEEFHKGGE